MAKKRKAKKTKAKRKQTTKKIKAEKLPADNVDALTPVASDEALESTAMVSKVTGLCA
jgi:hypothetical protein